MEAGDARSPIRSIQAVAYHFEEGSSMISSRRASANRLPQGTRRLSRSELMARIKSTGNKTTEIRLLKLFRAAGISGWRRRSTIYGRPDFVFRKERVAIFVDGCFWHGHPTLCRLPAANHAYWVKKILANRNRDEAVNAYLRRTGWKVVRVWEHELKGNTPNRLLGRILRSLMPSVRKAHAKPR